MSYMIFQHTKAQVSSHMTNATKREKKITIMVFLMIVGFLGPWSPYAILAIFRVCFSMTAPELAVGIALMFAKASVWGNTIIFFFMNAEVNLLSIHI